MQQHTSLSFSMKVLGSMLGNSLRATGSRNSMNGTMTNTRNGTRRNRSAVVRTSWKKTLAIIRGVNED